MSSEMDLPARGKIIGVNGDVVVFNPLGTNYELELQCEGFSGPRDTLVEVRILAVARKVWTVPSGGNFITPIQGGPPKIVQGRVRALTETHALVQASCPIRIELPAEASARDLNNGPITVGKMLNATIMPGAKLELVQALVA